MIARLPSWQKIKSAVVSSKVSTFKKFRNLISFFILSFFFFPLFISSAFANALSITNVELVDNVAASDTSDVEFDITWDNSWRDTENYDAVWVFVKYCVTSCTATDGTAVWKHATLKTAGTNPSNVSRGSGTLLDVVVSADKKGAFIQRTGNGTGTVTTTDINLMWDYGQDGVSDANAIVSTTRIKVFGIEMVYVPTGAFYFGDIGDGTAGGTPFNIEFGLTASNLPGLVGGEEQMNFGVAANLWVYNNSSANDAADAALLVIPPAFPKGYQAFYMMKYELTEQQYIDYFNTLTANGQTNRDITNNTLGGKPNDAVLSRNTISWTAGGLATTTRGERAMSYLSWLDVCSFLDWAALRPMTEMEFEKAARGPLYPVTLEFAWGTTTVSGCVAAGHSGAGTGAETCTAGACAGAGTCYVTAANITFTNGTAGTDDQVGPTRVGIYASSSTTRQATGASYWGILDLSGNLSEMVVNLGGISGGQFTSRQYAGTHGDGNLVGISSATYDSNATNQDWPGLSTTVTQGVTTAKGTGTKGGSWTIATASPSTLRVGNRTAVSSEPATRANTQGGRGVRTASA